MQKQPIYRFYYFGTCERFLQDAHQNMSMHAEDGIPGNIGAFLRFLDELGLTVTRRVAEPRLAAFLKSIKDQETLAPDKAVNLQGIMAEIRTTLDAELAGVEAYTPTPKRLDLKHLLETIGSLFAPNTYDVLPEIARFDFAEAGKCIAFERPTAAAFHILRATESTLRFYYEHMIRNNRITGRMWGPIVQDLRQRPRTREYDVLNNHLDNIRNSFRNPTQHPEARYDIHEVQDLWSVCVDVVNRMIRTLRENNRI